MTRAPRPEPRTEGFTLVELSVAIVLGALLAGLLFAVYRLTAERVQAWRDEVLLQDHLHLATVRLAADLTAAEQVGADLDGGWTLEAGGAAVRYEVREGALWRNGVRLHDAALTVRAFRLEPSADRLRQALRRRETEDHAAAGPPPRVAIYLTLAGAAGEAHVETAVALRQERPWPALDPLPPSPP